MEFEDERSSIFSWPRNYDHPPTLLSLVAFRFLLEISPIFSPFPPVSVSCIRLSRYHLPSPKFVTGKRDRDRRVHEREN